nr:unnamed protein product [Callosobruchus chinensis]
MWKILCAGSAERQLKQRNTSSSIVLPCAEEEARIWKLSRRREDRSTQWVDSVTFGIVTEEGANEANHLRKRFLTIFHNFSLKLRYAFDFVLDD